MPTTLDVLRFLLPLAATNCILDVAEQFLASLISRTAGSSDLARDALAAWILALHAQRLLSAPLYQAATVTLNLGSSSPRARTRSLVAVAAVAACATAALLLASAPPVGRLLFERAHGVSPSVARLVRAALRLLAPLPLLDGLGRAMAGLLMARRRAGAVSAASLADIAVQIAAASLSFAAGTHAVGTAGAESATRPLVAALRVVYAGAAVRCACLLAALCRETVRPTAGADEEHVPPRRRAPQPPPPSARDICAFWAPLAWVQAFQSLGRPAVHLVVSRGADGADALAALAVVRGRAMNTTQRLAARACPHSPRPRAAHKGQPCPPQVYPVAQLLYGWLNETKHLAAAFAPRAKRAGVAADDDTVADGGAATARVVRRVQAGCVLAVLAANALLFHTPLHLSLLRRGLGIDTQLVARCSPALRVTSFLCLPVGLRSFWAGWASYHQQTVRLAASGPARLAALFCAAAALSAAGTPGATLGAGALLAAFTVEATTVHVACVRAQVASDYRRDGDGKSAGARRAHPLEEVGLRQATPES